MKMTTADIRVYEMLVRVRGFGQNARGLFEPETLGGRTFSEVTEILGIIEKNAAVLASGASQEAVSAKAAARETLRETMAALSRTARAVAVDMPGLAEKFRMPDRKRDQTLINTARAFVKDAAPLADVFIRHEMPANFLETLNDDIADMERAIHAKTAGRGAIVSANTAIAETMNRGLAAVRRLDGILANKLRNDQPQLAAWKIARHIEKKTRAKASGATAVAAVAPSAQPTA